MRFMRFTPRHWRRLWFVACETVVLVIPVLGLMNGQRAAYVDLVTPAFRFAWPALLLTSLVFFHFDRRLAIIGFVSCLLGILWALLPVLVV